MPTADDPFATLRAALEGRYEPQRMIGRGGMAQVFRARDLKHDRSVAIKVLHPELAATIGADRFLREIEIAARLVHPAIVPVHDSGTASGLLYYVMPYIDGSTLRHRLARELQLPIDEALAIAGEIAEGMGYAHERGVVHRDVKPENILFQSGHALLADFGVAALVDPTDTEPLTSAGVAIGTPVYMSPEQAQGSRALDGRSDIYSLGCVLYEMLAGQPPYTGATPQAILARKSAEPPPNLRTVRTTVSKPVEAAIVKALAPIPGDRYPTAAAFVTGLRTAASDRRNRTRGVVVWAVLILALSVSWPLIVLRGARPGLDSERVVVSTFENRTGLPALDGLGAMAADWVTQGLQQTGVVAVIPTPTARQAALYVENRMASRGLGDPIRELADETGAGTVISGSLYRSGEALRVQVQVTDVGRRRLLGAVDPVFGPIDDPIDVLGEVRSRVMALLAISFDDRLEPAMTGGRPPTFAAYRAFNDGMEHYIRNEYESAIDDFDRAFASDSSFVVARLYASLNYANLGRWAQADSVLSEVSPRKEQLSDYHRSWLEYRQALVGQDRRGALVAIRRAATMAPGSKAVYNLGVEAIENGQVREALAALTSLTPERGPMRGWVGYWGALTAAYHILGQYDEELSAAREARGIYPDRLWARALEMQALAARGRIKEIMQRVVEMESLPADPAGWTPAFVRQEVADELRAHGYEEAGLQLLEAADRWYDAMPLPPPGTSTNRWRHAQVLMRLERWDSASTLVSSLRSDDPRDVRYLGAHGVLLARRQQPGAALAIRDSLGVLEFPYSFGIQYLYQAYIAVALDRPDSAVRYLRTAFADGWPYDIWVHRDPFLAPLAPNRAFAALIQPR